MRIYWINQFSNGKLGMMARPKGNDWLEDEIKKLQLFNVNCVVSLLENHEIEDLDIEQEEKLCQKYGIQYINYPIPDRNIPDEKSYLRLISEIDNQLKSGQKIVVHCRMGIGRTSVICAGILIKNGIKSNEVFDILSEIRTLKVPDTQEQYDWIQRLDF